MQKRCGIHDALLSALGERDAACTAEQEGGICQMGLSLMGAVAIATVLLGAADGEWK